MITNISIYSICLSVCLYYNLNFGVGAHQRQGTPRLNDLLAGVNFLEGGFPGQRSVASYDAPEDCRYFYTTRGKIFLYY